MQEKWWEDPVCFICDRWWLILLAMVLFLSGYFTRDRWLTKSDVCFSGSATAEIGALFPWTLKPRDVIIAFDLTGSMGPTIDGAKQSANRLLRTIAWRSGKTRFALVGFADYTDFPYRVYQTFTTDRSLITDSIDGLLLADGGDLPEDYARIVFEAYSDPALAWDEKASRYLIIYGDSYPHEQDPGRDETLGTADDLLMDNVVAELADNGIVLFYVYPGGETSDPLIRMWDEWTASSGGSVVTCAD